MSNAVSSLIFAFRNVDKTKNGEIGRAPVAAAQSINVFGEISKYNKAIANGANATVGVFKDLAKQSKVINYAVKGVNFATKNVNPLICISSGIKVFTSDDKTDTAIKEVSALSMMFAGEAIAKNALPKIIEKLPLGKKMAAVTKGILFVGASIGSYALGEHMGKDISSGIKANLAMSPAKINQIA